MRRSPVRSRSRLVDIVAGFGALVSLLVLVGGIPAGLYALGGNPFAGAPHSWHTISDALLKQDVSGALFIHILTVVGWLAWATFAISVVVEIVARLRGRRTVRLPGLGLPQRWAAGLITAVALAFSTPVGAMAALPAAPPAAAVAVVHQAPLALPAGPALASPLRVNPMVSGPIGGAAVGNGTAGNRPAVNGAGAAPAAARAGAVPNGSMYSGSVTLSSTAQQPATALVYEVRHGDYLGAIAQRFGGTFADAKALAAANHIDDPNMIRVGWRIKLPPGAQDGGPTQHAGGRVFRPAGAGTPGGQTDGQTGGHTGGHTGQASGHPGSTGGQPGGGKPGGGQPGGGSAAKTGGTATGTGTKAGAGHTGNHAGAAASGQAPGGTGTTAPAPANDSGHGALVVDMLEASGTLAAVVSLALVVIRKREQLQHRLARNTTVSALGATPPRLMEATRESDILRLDAALRMLAEEVADWPVEDIPQIAGVWLDQGATTLLLADECRTAPAPFVDDDNGWLLPPDAPLPVVDAQIAPLPALCTVGGRANQHVLLDLEYLRMLAVGGDRGEVLNLLRFLVVELCHNVWSDDVRVTLAGFGAETATLAAVDPIRVRSRASVSGAIDEFSRQLAQAVTTLDDVRTPEVLVIANPGAADQRALLSLERQLLAAPGVGMSVVVGPTPEGGPAGRYHMTVGPGGDLHIGFLGDAIVPAAALPAALLPDVVTLLAAARTAGDHAPLDLARAASRAARANVATRPARLAGQHRHDGTSDRRSFREELSDLAGARNARTGGLSWNT